MTAQLRPAAADSPSTQTATNAVRGRDRQEKRTENKNNQGLKTGGCGCKESDKKMRGKELDGDGGRERRGDKKREAEQKKPFIGIPRRSLMQHSTGGAVRRQCVLQQCPLQAHKGCCMLG